MYMCNKVCNHPLDGILFTYPTDTHSTVHIKYELPVGSLSQQVFHTTHILRICSTHTIPFSTMQASDVTSPGYSLLHWTFSREFD